MKTRIIATAVALLAFTFGQAQQEDMAKSEINSAKGITFSEGDIFVEGYIKFGTTGSDNNIYSITPKVGYFLSNKFAVGADLDFGGSKAGDDKVNSFGFGGFGRYYFLELDKKRFKAYGEAGLGYNHTREKGPTYGDETTNGIKANVTIGLNYFLTKNFAVSFVLADILSYNNSSIEDGATTDSFEMNINLFNNIFTEPQLGLLYKF
ncbi:porin family protein [Tamlana sp. 2_MG-2023]|uniref:porin family protein n=1 Tax=unclassified Tamlana TaxID=2614803 RepID=UPI0026E39952|nr:MULTISPECIES: porin family protein [unclassified Tamlana]MDO6761337.1 porin family protein [Tamlana sp. 2_MG-2023]MDO6791820.1 porin family protein [Tamlana sp. 1_MG-2023]